MCEKEKVYLYLIGVAVERKVLLHPWHGILALPYNWMKMGLRCKTEYMHGDGDWRWGFFGGVESEIEHRSSAEPPAVAAVARVAVLFCLGFCVGRTSVWQKNRRTQDQRRSYPVSLPAEDNCCCTGIVLDAPAGYYQRKKEGYMLFEIYILQ